MAYQPVFVRVCDENGCVQSHSCRRKVHWITLWTNTEHGEMFDGTVSNIGGTLALGKSFTAKVEGGVVKIRLKKRYNR